MMRFDRRVSADFERAILERPLLQRFLNNPGALGHAESPPPALLDAQLRLGDVVTIYAGTTKVLDIKRAARGGFTASAAATYTRQAPSGVFGAFAARDLTECVERWDAYCASVKVGSSWLREGRWQAWLARRGWLGMHTPWAVLDREAQPEGVDKTVQGWLAATRGPWKAAMGKSMPRQRAQIGGEDAGASPDFVGVLPNGDLAIIEVKHGSSGSGIYCGPVQVGGYAALWSELLDRDGTTVENLNAMIAQRQRLGLIASDFPRVRSRPTCVPVLVVGAPKRTSPVWGSDGLLAKAIQAAARAGAPLTDLQVWVASESDMRLRNVTKTLVP